MATRRYMWWLVAMAMAAVLAGCGGSTFNLQNPTGPGSSGAAVAITFKPAPPTALQVSAASTNVIAVVNNDTTNAGVDWVLSCGNASSCGTLLPQHTASDQAASYTPPTALFPPTNNQMVHLVAYATADHTKNILASIAITAFGSFLQQGTYVFKTSGVNFSGQTFQRAGAVVLDGQGGVLLDGNGHAGEQTVNFVNPNTGALTSVSDYIVGGSYFVGSDGRGTLNITTNDVNLGQQGVETYSFIALSNSQALVTKMDFLNDPQLQDNNESAVGTLDLQTNAAAPALGYAFVGGGTDVTGAAIALGGVLNFDLPNSISGTGSVFDLARNDGSGTVTTSSVSGTVSAPDSFGAVQIGLTTSFATNPLQFTGYIVDASHMQVIESDAGSGSGFGVTVGMALGQGPATGSFTTTKAFAGSTFVYGLTGQDLNGVNNSLAAVGTVSPGNLTLTNGFLDEIQNGLQVQVSDKFHGAYAIDPAGTGRVNSTSFTFNHTINGAGPQLVFYLTGKGSPALVLDADLEPKLGGAGVATGIAYPALKSGSSFSGAYGLYFTQNLGGGGSNEADGAGEMTADSTNLTVSGVVDADFLFFPTPGIQGQPNLSDGFQPSTVTGINNRLTGTLMLDSSLPDVSVAYYLIDSNHGYFVENDGGANGTNPSGLTFGYFATRTPVCQGCP